ncbi:hypothetical protein ACIRP0_04840 [Streptomyces sp. NPDC101733]|uniref:hypothetical protein n=1 Tax=unclassified Streptomyces TaxID=2593676 RepID=UPI0037F9F422
MGAIRSSATALLSVGATGVVVALGAFGVPAALAAEAAPITSFGFAITPSTVAPGGQTVLSVSGCGSAFASASSGVFDTVSIARGKTARVTVDRDARPGAQYSVSFTCDGETGSADLTITGGTTRPTTSSTNGPRTTPPATPRTTAPGITPPRTTAPRTTAPGITAPRATRVPTPPRTTAPRVTTVPTPPRTTVGASRGATLGVRGGLGGSVAGMDPLEIGAGAALVLGGAGGTAYAVRRRGSTRNH